MRSFRDSPIRHKLMAITMLTSLIVLVLSSAAFIATELISFRSDMIRDLSILAEVIGTNSSAALIFNDEKAARETLVALKAEPHIISAHILTKDGKVFVRYSGDDTDKDPSSPESKGDERVNSPDIKEKGHHFRGDSLSVSRQIVFDGDVIGAVYLESDLEEMYSSLKRDAGIVFFILLVSSLVAYLVSSRLQRMISDPIFHLVEIMKLVSNGKKYSIRAEKQSNDELGVLNDGLNEMLGQIQNRDQELESQHQLLEEQVVELQQADKELKRHAVELVQSNQELQQFAYIASHDLQEPLRMVASYTQLLARRYKGRLDSDADEFIAFAVDGATRMQELINGLLSYSRVGTRGRDFEPVDCEAVFDRTLANLKKSVEDSGANVTHDPLPTLIADDMQLGQMFQNLISNSIKFRSDKAPRIHVSAAQNGDEWIFSVRDNGIGVDPEGTERIFVMFQRLHNRSEYPGTGIGLAICKKIAERHGGRIWIESDSGKGSTFWFTIPQRRGDNHG